MDYIYKLREYFNMYIYGELWTGGYLNSLPIEMKLLIGSQDLSVLKTIFYMFEDIRKFYKKFPKLLSIQLDKFIIKTIYENTIQYTLNGLIHKKYDKPAVIMIFESIEFLNDIYLYTKVFYMNGTILDGYIRKDIYMTY